MVAKARKTSKTTNPKTLKAMYPTTVVANAFLEGMRSIARRSGRYLCDISLPYSDMLGGFGNFFHRRLRLEFGR